MPQQVSELELRELCNTQTHKENLKTTTQQIARRINTNTNVGNIDCSPRNVGDSGYKSFAKQMTYVKKVTDNPDSEIKHFIDALVSSTFANYDIKEWMYQMLNDSQSEIIADNFFNTPDVFYTYLGITLQDRQ